MRSIHALFQAKILEKAHEYCALYFTAARLEPYGKSMAPIE
jgi:hypothetical protein